MNEFEVANRVDKAWRLVVALEHFYKEHSKRPITPGLLPTSVFEYAQTFTLDNWAALAGLYSIKPPSPATVEVVLHILKRAAEDKDEDPFRQLEDG